MLGIIGVIFFCMSIVPGLPAVICGHLALSKIKYSKNTLSGKGMAIGGLCMGYIAITFFVLTVIIAFVGGFKEGFEESFAAATQRHPRNVVDRSPPPYEYGSKPPTMSEVPEHLLEKHGFAVRFPEKPKVTDYGRTIHYDFGAGTESTATYSVFVRILERPLLTNEAIKSELEGYLEGGMKVFGDTGKMVTWQEVLFLGHRALDYEYTKEVEGFKSYFKGVHFVAGNMSYTISVACIEQTKPSAYQKYDDFIRSFRLTRED